MRSSARAEGGPRLHLPRHGGAGAVARRLDRGDAGPGGRQDRAQAAGNAAVSISSAPTRGPAAAIIFVNLKGDRARRAGRRRLLPGAQEDRRHPPRRCPRACSGPSSTTSSATPTSRSTPLTGQGYSYPELKTFAKNARDILLRIPGVAKVDLLGDRRRSASSSRCPPRRWPSAGSPRSTSRRRSPARTPWTRRAASRPASARCASTWTGGLRTVEDIRELRLRAGQSDLPPRRYRRGQARPRGPAGRKDPLPGPGGGAARHHHGARASTSPRSAPPSSRPSSASSASCPSASSSARSPTRPQVVSKSVHEFLQALAEAIGIVLVVSFLALGWRAGLVVALTIPLVLAATFFVM